LTTNNRFSLFGLYTSKGSFIEITNQILAHTQSCSKTLVLTPNVDHFIRWKRSTEFRNVYSKANFCVIDGVPLVWMSRLLGNPDVERITGVDLAYSLIRIAEKEQIPLGIIGGSAHSLDIVREKLKTSNPNLELFMSESPTAMEIHNQEYIRNLASRLEDKGPRIVLICLGSPKQEFFFEKLEQFQISGTYLCVGGTVDFLAGTVKRAPLLMRHVGLEWFYRFTQEPFRLFHRYFIVDFQVLGYLFLAPFYGVLNRRLESRSHVKK